MKVECSNKKGLSNPMKSFKGYDSTPQPFVLGCITSLLYYYD